MITLQLSNLLEERKMTILQLSEEIGVSRSTLNSMINGTTKGIQFSTIDTLCNYFKCDINDLIEFIPTVEKPKLHSISLGQEVPDQYLFLFVYNYSTRYGIEHTGIRLSINISKKDILLNVNIATNKDIHNILYGEDVTRVLPRRRKDIVSIKKENESLLLPETDVDRKEAVFEYYNLALSYSEKVRKHIDSIDRDFDIIYTGDSSISNFFSVPYTTRGIFNDIKVTKKNIIDSILSAKELLIEDKIDYIQLSFICEKTKDRKSSLVTDDDNILIKHGIVGRYKSFEDVHFQTIKTFDN